MDESNSKGAQNELYSLVWARQLESFWDYHGFDPFLSHLWFQIGPFSRPFPPGQGPKLLTMG